MKVGDEVRDVNKPEYGVGKIVRFYANHGTILVDFVKDKSLKYCGYENIVESKIHETREAE